MDKDSPMISLAEAFETMDRTLAAQTLPGIHLPVDQAVGRTLRTDQISRLDLPPFNKSAMDGYAVLAGDDRREYRVLEVVPAGQLPTARLEPGTAVKVMTGAAVPQGAGRVIMIEKTEVHGEMVRITTPPGKPNICVEGEDIRRGETVLPAGTTLGPLDVANLVSCGITEVEVARAVRLAILCTGDEIVDSPRDLSPGKIMNSNGPLLRALAQRDAMEVVICRQVGDDPGETTAALRSALADADVIAVSGGVSMGDCDLVPGLLRELGTEIFFEKVAMQPGKPTVFGRRGRTAVFGLPGNPVSVLVAGELFLVPAVRTMMGFADVHPPRRQAVLVERAAHKPGRVAHKPAVLEETGEGWAVRPLSYHGSAHIHALSRANCLIVLPPDVAVVEPPAVVEVIELRV